MPLQSGRSKSVISGNIRELMSGKPSASRAKGIRTLADRRGIKSSQARRIQAAAIAYHKARGGK